MRVSFEISAKFEPSYEIWIAFCILKCFMDFFDLVWQELSLLIGHQIGPQTGDAASSGKEIPKGKQIVLGHAWPAYIVLRHA